MCQGLDFETKFTNTLAMDGLHTYVSEGCLSFPVWYVKVGPERYLYLMFTDFSQLEKSELVELYEYFGNCKVDLGFPVPFQWDIQHISNCLSKWLVSDGQVDHFSVVGVMSSTEFSSVIANCLGKRLATAFKALIYSASTLRSLLAPSQHALEELSLVTDYAGFQILHQLESHISPRKFKLLSLPARLGLFLVLTGSIIATKYYQEFVKVRKVSFNSGIYI